MKRCPTDCRPSFLNTSEESRERLIFSTQCHRVLISSHRLLKKCVTLIPAENNRTQVCFQIELAEEKSRSIHSQVTTVSRINVLHERKKSLLRMVYQTCVYRPESGPKHFDKLKPEPGPT